MQRVAQLPRAQPLAPAATLGVGPAARALARRLLQLTDEQLLRLKGLAGDELLLVLGAAEDLPWADGVLYLGREPTAPGLYLDCAIAPSVPPTLLASALQRRFEQLSLPLVVSLEPRVVISAALAESLSRARIRAWLDGEAKS